MTGLQLLEYLDEHDVPANEKTLRVMRILSLKNTVDDFKDMANEILI